MRPIDFCRPIKPTGTLRIVRFPLFRERRMRLTPHRTLRSSPSPRSPLIVDQSGSRAVPPFASSPITLNSIQRVSRPDSVPAPLLWRRLPLRRSRLREPASSAAFTVGGDASGTLVACPSVAGRPRRGPRASERLVKDVGRFGPGCLRSLECAASFGRFRDRALRRPPLRRRLPREGDARSFVIRRRKR
jgi:hypothetical protein